ncbi:DUF58 domain-containing protein, partial [bacterium]|nr:DUF58 domain-containing protein [bacterium]
VDWCIYARTDRLSVKLYREEVTPHLDLLVDGSRSMSLEGTAKSAATASLAALLATAAQNAQCSRAVWVAGEGFRRLANDAHSPAAWDHFDLNSTLTPDQAFEMLPPKLRRMGVRVLVSDLLWPGDPLQTVRRLRQGAAALFIVQLLAREDAEPPEHGSLRLVDSETGATQDVFVDAAVRERYLGNLSLLQQAWDNACQQCGARMATLIAGGAGTELECAALESMQLLVPA